MKNLIILLVAFCSLSFYSIHAQTNVFIGANNSSWHDSGNWSLGTVPASGSIQVKIPEGKTVINNGEIFFSTGKIEGPGILKNSSQITFTGATSGKTLENLTIENNGTILIDAVGAHGFFYWKDFTLNNNETGEFVVDGRFYNNNQGEIYSFNNFGLIKVTSSDTGNLLRANLVNQGTVELEGDAFFKIQNGNHINATFNVEDGAKLVMDTNNFYELNITGDIQGTFEWTNNSNGIALDVTANLNLTGNGILFKTGTIQGPGTLVNNSQITISGATSGKTLDNLILENNGTILIDSVGAHGYFYWKNFTLNNNESGEFVVEGRFYNSNQGEIHSFNNFGLIKVIGSDTGNLLRANLVNQGTVELVGDAVFTIQNGQHINSTFNIENGAYLGMDINNIYEGNITGDIQGVFEWKNNSHQIAEGTTATLNIEGNGILFKTGKITGPGTLVNNSKITFSGATSSKTLDNLTLENNGTILIDAVGAHGYFYWKDFTLNNNEFGEFVVEGQFYNSNQGEINTFNNNGLIKVIGSSTSNALNAKLVNQGTIELEDAAYFVITNTYAAEEYFNYHSNANFIVQENASLMITKNNIYENDINGDIQGLFEWSNSGHQIAEGTTATLNMDGNGVLFKSGTIKGPGTLENNSKITFSGGTSSKTLDNLTLENNGTILIDAVGAHGYFYWKDFTLNNNEFGEFVVEGQFYNSNQGEINTFNNNGLIKVIGSSTSNALNARLVNQGTIELEETAYFVITNTYAAEEYFNYHSNANFIVQENASLMITKNNIYENDLNGDIQGKFEWSNSGHQIAEGTTASLNMDGNGVLFKSGTIKGPGTLENNSKITFSGGTSGKTLDNLTLDNNGTILIDAVGAHGFFYWKDFMLNNNESGEFIVDSNFYNSDQGGNIVNNYGLISNETTSNCHFKSKFYNHGLISSFVGNFQVTSSEFRNEETGVIEGLAFTLPSNTQNLGTILPNGEETGPISLSGLTIGYQQEESGKIVFDIEGAEDFDTMHLQTGTASEIDGELVINLKYDSEIGDQFLIMTSNNALNYATSDELTAIYDGWIYTFEISYQNSNKELHLELNAKIQIPCETPTISVTAVDDTGDDLECVDAEGSFYVKVILSGGSGNESYTLTDSSDTTLTSDLLADTSYQAGPYAEGETPSFTIIGNDNDTCFVPSDVVDPNVCIIPCEAPAITLTAVDENGEDLACVDVNGSYFVQITLSGGSGNASYNVSANGDLIEVNADGSIVLGPFAASIDVDVSAIGVQDDECEVSASIDSPVICAPSNNDCVDAEPISCGESVDGTTLGATLSGMPNPSCAGGTPADVFYSLEAEVGIEYTVTVNGDDYDAILVLYSGSCGDLTELPNGCADNGPSAGVAETITFTVEEATTILIRTYDWSMSAGSFTLSVSCEAISPVWDCPDLEANIGDACQNEDGDLGVIDENCDCYVAPEPCEAPEISISVVDADGDSLDCVDENGEYYVFIELIGGSGNESYTLSDGGVLETDLAADGTYLAGPYDEGLAVNFTIIGNEDDACSATSDMVDPDVCDAPCEAPEVSVIVVDADGDSMDCVEEDGEYYVLVALSGGSGNASYTVYDSSESTLESNLSSGSTFLAGPYAEGDSVSFLIEGNDDSDCYVYSETVDPEICVSESCEAPEISVSVVDSDGDSMDCVEEDGEYYVLIELSGGSGNESYTVYDSSESSLESNLAQGGTYLAGPYNAGESVGFLIEGNDDQVCFVETDTVDPDICVPEPSDDPYNLDAATSEVYISNVQMAGIGADWENPDYDFHYTFNEMSIDGYGIITNPTLTIYSGLESAYTVSSGPAGNANQYYYSVWIDFNQDGYFDASEQVIWSNDVIWGGGIPNGQIGVENVPFTFAQFAPGTYQARIRNSMIGHPLASGAGDGEALDFTIYVITEEEAGLILGVDNQVFTDFTYYPNPVENQLNLQSGTPIEQVEVYNLLGQQVIQVKPNTLETTLDTDRLQSGVYLLNVTIDGSQKTFRIVKK